MLICSFIHLFLVLFNEGEQDGRSHSTYTYVGEQKCIEEFDGKRWRKQTILEIDRWMGW